MPKITELWCFAMSDMDDDDEGIPGVIMDGRMFPLMGADSNRIESLRPLAQDVANRSGKHLRIYKFTHKEQMGEVMPSRSGMTRDDV